ncbi:MAG: short-chain fatty acyl-CoA regulator family protein, partial [Pseudomonadota bacterium]
LPGMMSLFTPYPPRLPPDAGWVERRAALAMIITTEFFVEDFGVFVAEAFAAIESARSEESEALMRAELAQRLADAIILPAYKFLPMAQRVGFDVDALGRAADGETALALRRLACLHGLGGPRTAQMSVDASGRVTARRGALDLTPRARMLDCPVWPAHRAPPGGVLPLPVRDPEDNRALAVAWTRPDGMASEMALFDADGAARTIYAALAAGKPADVGAECRICAHQECRWRREASVVEV